MKKSIVLLSSIFLLLIQSFAQKDIVISGGNSVSSYVDNNNRVYVWGNNKTEEGTGLLGTNGTADYYSIPQLVIFPINPDTGTEYDIKQVNSGSGSHFVALDSYNNVWAWGNNSNGQIGNKEACGINCFVDTPTRVSAGELTGTHWDNGEGYLTNVAIVYAGSLNSFAILDNGNLVSWGANGKGFFMGGYDDAYGQLGNGYLPDGGIIDNRTEAGYVRVSDDEILANVIEVYAGDNSTIALVDDDGDGVGTMYTWGTGRYGNLARDANGTTNPCSDDEVKDPYARPARYADGSIMDNITAIMCGDVFAGGIDVDGYVWTWGNGGWNNATGNSTVNYTGSDPRKVLAGTTTGASNDGEYLLAKAIAAGQGFGMAVTVDGKPVAWGGGGCNDGGATGNGTMNGSSGVTEYIQYAENMVHDDVILINRGDRWGFYGRVDGSMWAWGCNNVGQLGLGNTEDMAYATEAITNTRDCLALTPEGADSYYCVGSTDPVSATVSAVSGSMGEKISWFTFDPVGQSGAGIADVEDNNLTYTSSFSTAVATSEVVYVAEYDLANDCWSAGLPVKITIVDNPVATLTPPTDICATDGVLNIDVSPLSGTLTQTGGVSGFDGSTRTWDPSGQTAASVSLDLEYLVEETHGSGASKTTCSATETASVTSHFMEIPTPEPKNWLINDIAGIPGDFMTASVSGTGTAITWYDTLTKDNELSTTTTYTPDRVALQEEVNNLKNQNNGYVKSYWITQTDGAGCESEPVEVMLMFINDCPYLAPEVVGEEQCVGELFSDISASVPATTTVPVDEWKWYDDAMNLITNNSDTYTHGVDNMTAGTTTYNVSYIATETISGNPCETPTTEVSVVVNPLPEITITAPATICHDAGDQSFIEMTDYHSNGAGSGVWAVDGASVGINSSGVFDPSFNGETTETYEISYSYTDGKGCENIATQDVLVQFTPAPTTTDHLSMTQYNETVEIEATGLESGASVKWYETLTSTLAESTDNPYQILSIPGDVVIDNEYRYATQTVNGCESVLTQASIQIVDGPFFAPEVVGEEQCVGEVLSAISASAPATTTVPVDEWKWYDDAMNPITNNSDIYTHSVDNMTAGTSTFNVSYIATESISGNQYESPTAEVTVVVNPLPKITITAPATICYDAGDQVFMKTIDVFLNGFGTGAWAVDGATAGINSSGVFDPSFNGAATQTYEVSYAYTDGKGCRDTAREDVTVQFTPAPTTVEHLSMIIENKPVEIVATGLETGASVKWYESLASTLEVSIDNPYQLLRIPEDEEIETSRFASQTVNGCESERTETAIKIIDCPVPAPDVTIASPICIYEDTPPIEATIGSGWLEGTRPTGVAPEFKFYESETATTPLEINTTGEYVPVSEISIVDEYTIWVSEYNYNVVPQACEGPRTPVTIKVYKVWKPVVADVQGVCEGATNNTFTAQDAVGTVEWYDETEPVYPAMGATPVSSGVTYTPNFTTVGSHMVYAVNKKEVEPGKFCVSEADEGTIEIKPLPEPPTTTPAEICLNEPNIPVCATAADASGYINWYGSFNTTTKLQTNQLCYTPEDKTMPGEYTLYATETVNDCESEKAPVEYTIKPRPDAPIIEPLANLCIYDDDLVIYAIGENITWYENGSPIATGTSYTHVITETGRIEYRATQTVDECGGAEGVVSFRIIGQVPAPTADQKYMCEGGAVPMLESDGSSTQWYSDEAAQSLQKIGFTYQPNISLLGVGENEFYMLNLTTVGGKTCFSDTASVTLYVTDNCSDTSAPYFRQTLGELIDSAEILLASAEEEELKTMRLYQSGAIAFLESEKASAQEVYDDSYATQTEIDAAVEQLKQAITDFHAMDITAISNVDDMPFVLYPNPADDYITISQGSSNSAISHIIIKNPAHIPVLETTKTHIDVSALPRGTYICEIYTAEGVWIKLLVLK